MSFALINRVVATASKRNARFAVPALQQLQQHRSITDHMQSRNEGSQDNLLDVSTLLWLAMAVVSCVEEIVGGGEKVLRRV